MDLLTNLKTVDPEIQKAIDQELSRQREKLEMIASENIVSTAVMQAQGSILTNKYAEGYPGKRKIKIGDSYKYNVLCLFTS